MASALHSGSKYTAGIGGMFVSWRCGYELHSRRQHGPDTELYSLAITDLTRKPMALVPKKNKQRQTQKGSASEAVTSTGSTGAGAEGLKKQKRESVCEASAAATGVMLKQLLRNEQDS